MKTYEIEQTATAVILWKGHAATEQDALDRMARGAGYRDYQDLEGAVGADDGVEIHELECNGHPAGTSGIMGETTYCDGSCR